MAEESVGKEPFGEFVTHGAVFRDPQVRLADAESLIHKW